MQFDVLIIGAGPAGIFTALELIEQNFKGRIALIEKGHCMQKRQCPKDKVKKCINCQPCNITTGFSGAGAFSDGKLSLSPEVGGDFPELVGVETAKEYINYADSLYLRFGADTKIEGIGVDEKVKSIRKKAILAGLKLVDCPIRHLGTEKAQEIYTKLQEYLIENGVEVIFDASCEDIIIKDNVCVGAICTIKGQQKQINASKVVVATGRRGASWLENICRKYNVKRCAGNVDIGVRVEVRNEIMEEVNNVLYESKLIGYPEPFCDKVRTFCQNPGGFVSSEVYDNALSTVNGHSYKDKKSNNTNLAVLSTHHFLEPFDRPTDYAKRIGELTNMLGDGRIVVQRFGDIIGGKRTWEKELNRSNLTPTLIDAVSGDITSAMPYRTMTNIIGFIKAVDTVVPGFAGIETLLYSPEIKFYSNKVDMDKDLNCSVENLYCLGDSSGWTRGLMMASVMGVYAARKIIK